MIQTWTGSNLSRLLLITLLCVSAPLFTTTLDKGAMGQDEGGGVVAGPQVYAPTSEPFGNSYDKWGELWWLWAYSIPESTNPVVDTTGEFCAQKQEGPVWFLSGTFAGSVERTCTVHSNASLFFPILNSFCSPAEFPNLSTEEDMIGCAKDFQDKVTQMEASVDGKPVESYRVATPVFNFTLPENNIFGVDAGEYEGAGNGQYVFLKPLPTGEHEIHFKGTSVDVTATGPNTFAQDGRYHLTVSP